MNRPRLAAALPTFQAAEGAEDRIRAPLTLLLDPRAPVAPLECGSGLCPNCGSPRASPRSPYCGERCRAIAAFVRQFRHAVATEAILENERQIALGQSLWNLLGGGYPYRQSLIPARTIAKVIERDGGLCQACGAPATEVDHTGSG